MKPSAQIIEYIKRKERLRLKAYQDQRGLWTIGYGHCMGRKCTMDTCTTEQALAILVKDVANATHFERFVHTTLNQNQYDALVSLVFNIGIGHFSTSTLLKCLNSSDFPGAAVQFLVWDKCDGHFSQGHLDRRIEEQEIFLRAVI